MAAVKLKVFLSVCLFPTYFPVLFAANNLIN